MRTPISSTNIKMAWLIEIFKNHIDTLTLRSSLMDSMAHTRQASTAFMFLLLLVSAMTSNSVMAASTLVTITTTTNVYDSYGNPTSITVAVENDELDEYDNVITKTYTTYTENTYTNDTANWHLGRLTLAEVTQYLPDNTDTKDGTCTAVTPSTCGTRVSAFAYDATSGLLTQEKIEPDTPALTLTTDYLYDDFGNKTSVTVTGGSGTTAIASRTTTSTYDARGQFATSTTNALGHIETRTYDTAYGVMLTLTGPNNLTTIWTYDSFGRQIKETRADGTETNVIREWCDGFQGETGNTNCPTGGVLALTTQTDGAPTSIAFSDALGRVIQTETEGFDGTAILVDTVYDALGRIDKKSRPHFISATAQDIEWHTFTYDIVGRLLTETAPDASVTTSVYAGLQVSITNVNNATNSRMKNARGEIIYVVDNANNVTTYDYDPFGNLISVKDAAGNVTTNDYDIRGRKISMDDPDMGYWTYDYNALGELISQTDAKSQETTMDYDLLGRMITRVDDKNGTNEATSTWLYDYDPNATPTAETYADGQAAHSIGKLIEVNSAEGKTETYTFDSLGRAVASTTTIDSVSYTTSQTYDLDGRLNSVVYPASTHHSTGLEVFNTYNLQGYLETVTDLTTDYWTADSQNAEGQLTQFTFGNGVTTNQGYDSETGRISAIGTSTPLGVNNVQDLTFTFDAIGNLTQRADLAQTLTEDIGYDVLNRMTSSTLDDGTTITAKAYTYNAIGNLKSKTGIGTYTYGASAGSPDAGPHAVTSVIDSNSVNHDFVYDLNGNQTSGYNFTDSQARTQTWNSYNKVKTITQGTTILTFSYGANRARFKQVNSSGKDTIYIGSLYEKETQSGVTTHNHYIKAGGSTIALYKSKSDSTEELRYMHRDHIGSVTAITDEANVIVEQLSYDPHGKRRQMTWEDAFVQLTSFETTRGFTDHEMLDDVGLIHMGGRVYDPDLGRFISADPFIQEPLNSQSLNRYSYVLNNPLSFTDPSGYFFSSIFKAIKGIVKGVVKAIKGVVKAANKIVNKITGGNQILNALVAGAVGFYTAGLVSGAYINAWVGTQVTVITQAASVTASIIGGTAGGFVAGAIISGDLKTALAGGLTGSALAGVNAYFGDTWNIQRVFADGVVGGTSSEAQGGKFLDGFKSNFAVSSLNYANYLMRQSAIRSSSLDPSGQNINGESAGFFNDGKKIAGARRAEGQPCLSLTGGCQGAPRLGSDDVRSSFFGVEYDPNSVPDIINESFAGPHDFFRNLTGSYDSLGNSRVFLPGSFAENFDAVKNYFLVPPAAPFSIGGLISRNPSFQVSSQYLINDELREN